MKKFIVADRAQRMQMPYYLDDWLPEHHLARFVVEIVDKLDMSCIYNQYKGVGSTAYDPRMLLSLLFYGYSTGVFSSRKIESSTYDSVAFRFVAGNHHPDHDTISEFRKRFLFQIRGWFKEILLIGKELGLVKLGNIYIDGTKVQANASRHKAMSYEYIQKLEKQLEEEIGKLLGLATTKDESKKGLDLNIPEELKLRKDRLAKIQQAKMVVEQRAKERYQKEKEQYDAKMEQRSQKKEKTWKNPGGHEPKAPAEGPKDKDQYNFTDPQSRIMKTPAGYDQCFNSQAAVNDDMIIVGAYSNSHVTDRQEFIPAIESVPVALSGEITVAVADAGYFSENNIVECEQKNISPIISSSKEEHNSFLANILNPGPTSYVHCVTPVEKMTEKLKSQQGKEIYKKENKLSNLFLGSSKKYSGSGDFH